jgi:regulatory protein
MSLSEERPGRGGREPGRVRPAPAPDDAEGQELERALGLCFRELDRRELTVAQVRRRLGRAGTGAATIEAAVAWLIERRYVDDAGYAERFAADRRALDGWGTERIVRRLEALGIEEPVIEATLAGRRPGEELGAALGVLAARVKGAAGDDRDRRRALGLLARRGYELDLAEEAVRRHFGPPVD